MANITREMLVDLGVCGTYLDRFRREFPTSQFPDGVEVNRTICAEKHHVFDWDWASSVMLSRDAQRKWRENSSSDSVGRATLTRERTTLRNEQRDAISAWQEKYNQDSDYPEYNATPECNNEYNTITGEFSRKIEEVDNKIRAYTAGEFGALMEDPLNYSTAFENALQRETQRFVERQRREMNQAQEAVNDARSRIKTAEEMIENCKRETANAKRRITDWTAKLPDLEAKLVQAKAEYAEKQLARQEAAVADAQAKLDELRRQIAEAAEASKTVEAAPAEETTEASSEATS